MNLIKNSTLWCFDLTAIHRGNSVRVRHSGDTIFKNGFVTKTSDKEIQILYCNTQNNAASYLTITASDVADNKWELFWTDDFQQIFHHFKGDIS